MWRSWRDAHCGTVTFTRVNPGFYRRAEVKDDIYKATRLDRKMHPGEPWSLCRVKKLKTHNEVPALWDGGRAIVLPSWMALLGWKMSSLMIQGLWELQQVLPIILKKILAKWILFPSSGLCIPPWDSNHIWFVLSMWSETGVWPCFKGVFVKKGQKCWRREQSSPSRGDCYCINLEVTTVTRAKLSPCLRKQ